MVEKGTIGETKFLGGLTVTATLEKLADHIERRVPTEETPFLKEFSVQLFEKASPGFLREFDPESLMAITLGALRVLEERSLDDIWVRAFNPSYEADGWDCPWTALEVSLRDRPFIVDSITHELKRQSLDVYHLLHPIYYTHRDEDGRLRRDLTRSPQAGREVYELYLIERVEDEAGLRALEERVRQVLCDVVLATDDYQAMRAKVASLCESLAGLRSDCPDDPQVGHLEECESFLNWLTHHNFVFLGFREYDILEQPEGRFLQVNKDTALGILKNLESSNYQQPVPLSQLPDNGSPAVR